MQPGPYSCVLGRTPVVRRLFMPFVICILIQLLRVSSSLTQTTRSIRLTGRLLSGHSCPSLGRVLVNTYRDGISLFVGGETIMSLEGTTQGDPMAMAMYALGIKPLIHRLSHSYPVKQVWFADDCTSSGSLFDLFQWWHRMTELGPQYGYFPNPSKSFLLVKPDSLNSAKDLFHDSNISIVSDGARVLGVPVGTSEFVTNWILPSKFNRG